MDRAILTAKRNGLTGIIGQLGKIERNIRISFRQSFNCEGDQRTVPIDTRSCQLGVSQALMTGRRFFKELGQIG